MKTENDWLNFLMEPQNIECALEVGQHYVGLKHAVLDRLYRQLETSLSQHLAEKDATKLWTVFRHPAGNKWAGVGIKPQDFPDECPAVSVCLERYDADVQGRLVCGVVTATTLAALDEKTVKPLICALEALDYCVTNKYWVRRRWLEYYAKDHGFCVEAMASTRIYDDLLATITGVFDEFRGLMEKVNRAERTRFKPARV